MEMTDSEMIAFYAHFKDIYDDTIEGKLAIKTCKEILRDKDLSNWRIDKQGELIV